MRQRSRQQAEDTATAMEITNCHVHTFTHDHTPDRFIPWPLNALIRNRFVRRALIWLAGHLDPARHTMFARYAQIVEISYNRGQERVFEIVRGFYPEGTRFVVLPMDMTFMGAGKLAKSIEDQHEELAELAKRTPTQQVIPFAAVDPRHDRIFERTKRLLEEQAFRGIKLYPLLGYHPYHESLRPVYAYAQERGVPVLSHCSRLGARYRGEVTESMRTDPVTGKRLDLPRDALLDFYTDPDSYLPILENYPNLKLCLAHFGGDQEWARDLTRPWDSQTPKSWLAKILDMIRSGRYPNVWTDISYTVFADDEYVYLLKTLLADPRVSARVLFGSDFYVVANADLEERHRSVRIRAVLGEELFKTIAHDNPATYLG